MSFFAAKIQQFKEAGRPGRQAVQGRKKRGINEDPSEKNT
jgi:hypothetical protein